jgi:aspartyl-tRNA(Asn)/glutamyl-tRNA(Gln) amidotransferase subunit A
VLQPYLDRRDDFGADVRFLVEQGQLVPGTDYIDAQRLRGLYRKRWAVLWEIVDVVFTPTTPIQAPHIGQTVVTEEDLRLAATRFVRPFNLLGLPALSIPLLAEGLPAGLQIVGKPFADEALLRMGQYANSPQID